MRQSTLTEIVTDTSDGMLTRRLGQFDEGDEILIRYETPLSNDDQQIWARMIGMEEDYEPGEYDLDGPKYWIEEIDEELNDLGEKGRIFAILSAYHELVAVFGEPFGDGQERRLGRVVWVEPLVDTQF